MSRTGKLGLLLMSVVVVALILSSCFLPSKPVPPTFSVSPTTINAYSGQPFTLSVSAQGGNGIKQIVATFQGSTVTKTSNPATFTFVAPNVINQTQYPLGITVYGANGLSQSATETVNVMPYTSVGSITYAVRLNNPYPYVYSYPAQNNNQSVIFTVNVGNGAGLVGGVSVLVDGQAIPASPTTLSSVLKATVAGTTFIVQKSFAAFYTISLNHVGPHTFQVNFYGNNGALLGSSAPGYFYITNDGAQSVTLSAATPVYNTKYLNGVSGSVSFTAKATDYTSQYEGFLINGTPFATYVNFATAVSVLGKSYSISVPANSMTAAGTTTFTFKDLSIDGNVASANQTYVVVKATPVLRASYKSIPSSGNTLYVGITPTTFQVYAYDQFWLTSAATLGTQPFALTKNGTATVDVSGLTNNATEAFTAKVVNGANLTSTLKLTVVRVTKAPVINYANIYGLSTYNGAQYSATGTITVAASVTSPYLSSVTLNLTDGATPATYSLTKSSTGLWVATVNTANLLPGTYKSWISAQDLALNVATALTSPATVNVYRSVQNVFTTSLTTLPSTPVKGYVKAATLTANINSNWIYAIKKVYLYRSNVASTTKSGNYASSYPFTINASGTYFIVTVDNVNQRATGTSYTINIDNSTPTLKLLLANSTANASSISITGVATDIYSGIASLTLQYQTLGATGIDNGGWVTIGSVNGNNATSVSKTFTWKNLNTLPDGKYNIQLVATSGVGNTNAITGYVINNSHGSPNVVFTPSATLVFTNQSTASPSVKVLNESDVTVGFSLSSTSSTKRSTVVSLSYTAYPLAEATSLTFTSQGTYTYAATVTDLAGNSATHATVFVYDTTPASFSVTPTNGAISSYGRYVAAAGTPVTFTVFATDNLSGIKSVVINGTNAVLKTPAVKTGMYGQTLAGTYTATLTAPTSSGTWTVVATVTDNAGNVKAGLLKIFVDNSAPTISVSLVNVHGSQTITNGASEVNYTSTPASFSWNVTTLSGAKANVNGNITGPSLYSKSISTDSSMVSIEASGQYVITIVATNPINNLRSTFIATKTIVVDNTLPTVKLTLPATLNLANYSTAVATYTATDANFEAATLTINGISISVSKASSGTVLLSQFNLNGLSYRSMKATLTAIDKALNKASTSSTFVVDTVSPKINMTGTIYMTNNHYAVDVNFADTMKPTALASTDLQFYQGSTLWYNIAAATGVSYDPSTGFLHIYNLVTPAGSIVSVAALANHQFTVKVSSAFESLGGNAVSPSSTTVTFSIPYGTPKPVNP